MVTRRLLIVDDEAGLLDLLRRYLRRLEYEVETASTAEEALSVLAARPLQFDLVIADLSLPGMNGEELIARMRQHNPALRAMILSGYPYQPHQPGTLFLQKPFLPEALARAVAQALGEDAAGESSVAAP